MTTSGSYHIMMIMVSEWFYIIYIYIYIYIYIVHSQRYFPVIMRVHRFLLLDQCTYRIFCSCPKLQIWGNLMTIVKYRMLGTEYFKINRKPFDILHAFISKFRCSPLSSGMTTMHANSWIGIIIIVFSLSLNKGKTPKSRNYIKSWRDYKRHQQDVNNKCYL